jgi:FlaA1/EpsC-like NDP-sugar epimerase
MSLSIHRLSFRSSGLIAFESLLIVTAIATTTIYLLGPQGSRVFLSEGGLSKALLITAVCQMCLYYCDLYDLTGTRDPRRLLARLLQAIGATSIILAVLYSCFPVLIIGRGVFLSASGIVFLLIVFWRIAFDWLSSHDRRRSDSRESCSIGGENWASRSSASWLQMAAGCCPMSRSWARSTTSR